MMNNPSAYSASLFKKEIQIRIFHRRGAEYTEEKVLEQKIFRTLRTLCLCGDRNSDSDISPSLWCKVFFLLALLLHASAGPALSVSAITSDGTLGTIVNQGGTTYNITGGTRNGANLFHSLGLFSVGTGDTANFFNDTGLATSNILGRITGGQTSSIFGTIKTTNFGAANLYLINPAGWVFGPTASLNVGGSFHVSTANYLKFADGAKFHADLSKQSVLTSAPVSAFGFLSQNPAGITIQGSTLQVPQGQTLSVIGGAVRIVTGTLKAPGGRINIASVASPGEVIPVVDSQQPDLQVDSFTGLGSLEFSQGTIIDATGNGGGAVVIRGGRLLIDSSNIFADNVGFIDGAGPGVDIRIAGEAVVVGQSSIEADSVVTGDGRDLRISADTLQVDNSGIGTISLGLGDGGNITLQVGNLVLTGGGLISSATSVLGKAGDIAVDARNVTITDGAQIFSGTFRFGDSGKVRVTASDAISLSNGSVVGASSQPGSTGKAGDVVVEARSVTVTSGAQIFSGTFGSGAGATVRVMASDTINLDGSIANDAGTFSSGIFADSSTGSTGKAGDVVVNAKNVTVTGGALISSGTGGSGNGGTVRVTATDTVSLSTGSAILANGATGNTGSAGEIVVEAKNVTLIGDAMIVSSTFGRGHAGDIMIDAKNVMLTDGAQIASSTFGSGNAGTVQVTATDTVRLDGAFTNDVFVIPSGILVNTGSGSTGSAGDLVVQAKNVTVTGGARIASDTFGSGNGGTVQVTASNAVTLMGTSNDSFLGSEISSNSSGDGLGGSIDVRARQVILKDGAVISATSSGIGNAGNISIQANEFHSVNSAVTTQAETADGGNIHLTVGKLVDLFNSQITASVGTGNGSGGNITIDPTFVTLNHSQITANAFGGPGGNIKIAADVFLASPDSSVTASSALSTPGTVDVQAAITNISGLLEPLPENIFQATSLLRQSCAARFSGGKLSSLVVGSRDGLPLEPGSFMPSPLYRLDAQRSAVRGLKSEVRGQRSEVVGQRSEFQHVMASAKPRFSLNGPCVK